MPSLRRTTASLSLLLALAACGGDESPAAEQQTSAATERTAAGAAPAAEQAATPPVAAPAPGPGFDGVITPGVIRAYRLSMDRVRKLHEAEMEWQRLGGKESQVDARSLGPDATLADAANLMLRHFDNDPKAVAAMQDAGLSTREAALHTTVFTQATLIAAGAVPPSQEIAAENVEFVRANREELQRLTRERAQAIQAQRP
ncbi:MAG TPA: hypothetical protein VFQ45_21175 [Longimicrobium sp.]|nr:hypothetical protein [Longimicrobium sp.]